MNPSLSLLPPWLQIILTIIPTVSAVFAAIGLMLNVQQSRRTNRQARATLVAKFLSEFTDNADMQSIFYAIEYSKFEYNDEFHESDAEKKLDKTLVHFANLALAWKSGLLEYQDILPAQYFVRRLLRDDGVKMYLHFVENWSDHAELGEHPYQTLNAMGKRLGA